MARTLARLVPQGSQTHNSVQTCLLTLLVPRVWKRALVRAPLLSISRVRGNSTRGRERRTEDSPGGGAGSADPGSWLRGCGRTFRSQTGGFTPRASSFALFCLRFCLRGASHMPFIFSEDKCFVRQKKRVMDRRNILNLSGRPALTFCPRL